jgi:hypothetical protein
MPPISELNLQHIFKQLKKRGALCPYRKPQRGKDGKMKTPNTFTPGSGARLSQLGSELDADAEFNFFYPPSAGRGRS